MCLCILHISRLSGSWGSALPISGVGVRKGVRGWSSFGPTALINLASQLSCANAYHRLIVTSFGSPAAFLVLPTGGVFAVFCFRCFAANALFCTSQTSSFSPPRAALPDEPFPAKIGPRGQILLRIFCFAAPRRVASPRRCAPGRRSAQLASRSSVSRRFEPQKTATG